jgi:hypothetical protein
VNVPTVLVTDIQVPATESGGLTTCSNGPAPEPGAPFDAPASSAAAQPRAHVLGA